MATGHMPPGSGRGRQTSGAWLPRRGNQPQVPGFSNTGAKVGVRGIAELESAGDLFDHLWVMDVRTAEAFSADKLRLLFELPGLGWRIPMRGWDPWLDVRGFLMPKGGETKPDPPEEVILVRNWLEALERIVAAITADTHFNNLFPSLAAHPVIHARSVGASLYVCAIVPSSIGGESLVQGKTLSALPGPKSPCLRADVKPLRPAGPSRALTRMSRRREEHRPT